MTSDKKKRTQINFDIHPELHKEIKIRAARKNISMNLWIIRAIYSYIRKEDLIKDDNTCKYKNI